LTETLKTYGNSFSTSFWDVVFRGVLFPMFDDLKHPSDTTAQVTTHVDHSEWMSTTCVFALRSVLDLYNFFFDKLSFLLDSMLELFGTFIKQEDDSLSRIGCSCLTTLVTSNINRLSETTWDKILAFFRGLFMLSSPQFSDFESLASSATDPENPIDPVRDAVAKNLLQLLLIQTLNEIFNPESKVYEDTKAKYLLKVLDMVSQAHLSARNFNERFRKYIVTKEGRAPLFVPNLLPSHSYYFSLVDLSSFLPALLLREPESSACQLRLLFRLYGDFTIADREEARGNVELKLLRSVSRFNTNPPIF